jgi:GTP-binding protein Era
MPKVGFVTIVGKPNAGKSTLLNAVVGKKVAIATPRKNTTRNQIKGIYNNGTDQIIFTDTPGFLKSNNKLDERMHKSIINSIQGVDIILFLLPF